MKSTVLLPTFLFLLALWGCGRNDSKPEPTVVIAGFEPLPPGENRGFYMILVKDLAHNYPNGDNHWMKGAERHWAWLKQFSLP